jgi:hypothetical protein
LALAFLPTKKKRRRRRRRRKKNGTKEEVGQNVSPAARRAGPAHQLLH